MGRLLCCGWHYSLGLGCMKWRTWTEYKHSSLCWLWIQCDLKFLLLYFFPVINCNLERRNKINPVSFKFFFFFNCTSLANKTKLRQCCLKTIWALFHIHKFSFIPSFHFIQRIPYEPQFSPIVYAIIITFLIALTKYTRSNLRGTDLFGLTEEIWSIKVGKAWWQEYRAGPHIKSADRQ